MSNTLQAPTDVKVADLNHDAVPDVIVTFSGNAAVYAFLNNAAPTPTFAAHHIYTGEWTVAGSEGFKSVVVNDFDNDGNLDLAVIDVATRCCGATKDPSRVVVLLSDGESSPSFTPQYRGLPDIYNAQNQFIIASADIDGDLAADILVSANPYKWLWWLQNGCVQDTGPTPAPTSFEPSAIPVPAPTSGPTLEPTSSPTMTKNPTTETPLPSSFPTLVPSNLRNCQDNAVDDTLEYCRTTTTICEASLEFCQRFQADFGA